ncbi:MAG: orotate phosphoribosyltransferase [Deltaproteobacteria bacterium]|nr:orotate phosphoribosyltransferase [Deltaproteobacteria bacterium]
MLLSFDQARERLRELLRLHAVRHGTFKLASGRTSDFFVDCKTVVLSAEGHLCAGVTLGRLALSFSPVNAFAAVPLGGCPLASAASFASSLGPQPVPAIYVRKEAKDHGTAKLIEGAERVEGKRIVLLEDVVTTGGSSLRAAETLRAAGFEVAAAVCILDRLEGGEDAFRKAGIPLSALFTRRDFLP